MKAPRRVQRQKNPRVNRVQELRRSNAAQPVPSGSDYRRKSKHGLTWEEPDEDDIDPFTWR
jgi:hypothetical protein